MNAFVQLREKIFEATAPFGNDFDYSFVESQKGFWEQLAATTGSAVVVMDIYENRPLFVSETLFRSLGMETSALKENIANLTDYIHPADFQALAEMKFSNFLFVLNLPAGEKLDYKYVHQYRVKAGGERFLWMIEQQQVLRLDDCGNARVTLSVSDISPDQTEENRVESHIFNYRTGEIIKPNETNIGIIPKVILTEREKEILKMIQTGLLSKEISDRLAISFNTVNTHRRNIINKLNANNSLEAINHAKELGLI